MVNIKLFSLPLFLCLFCHDVSGVGSDRVSVMEGDLVTLNTGVQTNQQEKIRWYCNKTLIAYINGDLSKICTDVQCNEDTERFRDRLKLDHQTASLTITNTRNTDSGVYKGQIISGSSNMRVFSVTVTGVSAAERDRMKRKSVMEGESVTLDPGEIRKLNDSISWHFNDILIAEITGDQSKICTDVQCKERFRDRLKLDHQTGSLNITHTRTEDSGFYKLQISNSRFSIIKIFSVSVTDSGLSSAAASAISAAAVVGGVVLVLALVAPVIYYRCRKSTQTRQNGNGKPCNGHDEENVKKGLLIEKNDIPMVAAVSPSTG